MVVQLYDLNVCLGGDFDGLYDFGSDDSCQGLSQTMLLFIVASLQPTFFVKDAYMYIIVYINS